MTATLKNGATEIARISINGMTAVMAKTDSVQPFVTWRVDDDGDCYWGHYFDTHDEAAADMINRVG